MKILILLIAMGLNAGNALGAPSPVHSEAVSNFMAGLFLSDTYGLETFRKCFPNTLDTTVTLEGDGTTYIITGDIDAMWIRDSCSQIHPYIVLARNDADLRRVIKGTILRHIKHFNIGDPFINSWKENYSVHEYKYESDGPAYFIRMCWLYWKVTGDSSWTNGSGDFDCHNAFTRCLDKIRTEQTNHAPVTGLIYTLFRPSDDDTVYRYNIPNSMFIAAMMPKLKEMLQQFFPSDSAGIARCDLIRNGVMAGMTNYGTFQHPVFGKIWAFEVDGNGNSLLIDDANVPSLLSAPYIEFCSNSDPVYQNTRRFALSSHNPYYYEGSFGKGIGSYHTAQMDPNRAWPMAVIMQALTAGDESEISRMLTYLNTLDAGSHFMHEGVNVNNPSQYSRSWFAWANTLFGELVMQKTLGIRYYPGDGVYVKPSGDSQRQIMAMTNSVPFGDINNLTVRVRGRGTEITAAFVNGVPAVWDPVKGVKVTLDPASLTVILSTNSQRIHAKDLSGVFNRDAMSPDTAKNDGSIAGAGNTSYDAAYFPDVLFSSYSGTPFTVGSRVNGQLNAVACGGQTVALTNVIAAKIHVLAAGINGNQTGIFRVNYRDGGYDDILCRFTDWCADLPLYGEQDAVLMGHRHDAGADQTIKCHAFEYILFLNQSKIISSVLLPSNPSMIVLAMTISGIMTNGAGVPETDKVPKSVIGLGLVRSENSQVLSWDAVQWNTDNTPVSATSPIGYYRVYQSEDLVNWAIASEVTNTYYAYPSGEHAYFKVTAVNRGLREGGSWASISSSSNLCVALVSGSDRFLGARVLIPPASASQLLAGGNSLAVPLWLGLESHSPDADALYHYGIRVFKHWDNEPVPDFTFPEALDAAFYYRTDPVTGYIENTSIASSDAPAYLKIMRHNGVEWVYAGGAVDTEKSSVSVATVVPDLFKVTVKDAGFDSFRLMQMEPRKVFSPQSPAPNNEMRFYFSNPRLESARCVLYGIKGDTVGELPARMLGLTDGYFYWDGRDSRGKACAGGVYIYQMTCGEKRVSGTVILAR